MVFIPQILVLSIACLVFEPFNEKLTAVVSVTAVLDVYAYSETMVLTLILVVMLPHCVLYTFGVIEERSHFSHQGIEWKKKTFYNEGKLLLGLTIMNFEAL